MTFNLDLTRVLGELDRVGKQVQEDLLHPQLVGVDCEVLAQAGVRIDFLVAVHVLVRVLLARRVDERLH